MSEAEKEKELKILYDATLYTWRKARTLKENPVKDKRQMEELDKALNDFYKETREKLTGADRVFVNGLVSAVIGYAGTQLQENQKK